LFATSCSYRLFKSFLIYNPCSYRFFKSFLIYNPCSYRFFKSFLIYNPCSYRFFSSIEYNQSSTANWRFVRVQRITWINELKIRVQRINEINELRTANPRNQPINRQNEKIRSIRQSAVLDNSQFLPKKAKKKLEQGGSPPAPPSKHSKAQRLKASID